MLIYLGKTKIVMLKISWHGAVRLSKCTFIIMSLNI